MLLAIIAGEYPFDLSKVLQDLEGKFTVSLYRPKSRLQAMASAQGLVCIPEGVDALNSGEVVPVQLLVPHLEGM